MGISRREGVSRLKMENFLSFKRGLGKTFSSVALGLGRVCVRRLYTPGTAGGKRVRDLWFGLIFLLGRQRWGYVRAGRSAVCKILFRVLLERDVVKPSIYIPENVFKMPI